MTTTFSCYSGLYYYTCYFALFARESRELYTGLVVPPGLSCAVLFNSEVPMLKFLHCIAISAEQSLVKISLVCMDSSQQAWAKCGTLGRV